MNQIIQALPQRRHDYKSKERKRRISSNSMSPREYLLWNIICGVLYYLSYMNLSFTAPDGTSELTARIALTAAAAVWFAAGLALTFNVSRGIFSVAGNILPPYMMYFLLTGRGVFHAILLCALIVVAMLTTVLSVKNILNRLKTGTSYPFIELIRHYLIKSRNTIAMVFAVCLIISSVWSAAVNAFVPKGWLNSSPAYCTLENSADKLEIFKKDAWAAASESEKRQGLQTAADIETTRMQLPCSLTVNIENLNSSAIACYKYKTHTIYFNSAYFNENTNIAALSAVLHECYHAQQQCMINVYDTLTEEQKKLSAFNYIKQYKKELADYNDGEYDYTGYRNQQIESDAFAYAKQAILLYKDYLN